MLTKFFKNGQGRGAGPVGYLIARDVVAYCDNRDVLRDAAGKVVMHARDPLPEVLRGDPARTEALIDATPHQWSYRSGVLSFTRDDAPTERQQIEAMDAFERLAFAGLERDQWDILWVRHTHEGRVELHFVTPRMELSSGRSLNIAPPGYEKAFDTFRDLLNKQHGWADPEDPDRARDVVSLIERARRGEAREVIHDSLLEGIAEGKIQDRPSVLEALTEAGFQIPRAGKDYVTALDPETGERLRLRGDIFREDWTREAAVERALERSGDRGGDGETGRRGESRRLAGLDADELKAACERSSSSALSTIEADMANLVLANRRAISGLSATMRADLNLIRQLTHFAPWAIATSLILLIATSFALSWCWAQAMVGGAEKIALQRAGITPVQTPSGAILLVDNSRLTLATCHVQGQPVACLTPTPR